MKIWLDPPLTAQEKRTLAIVLPPLCAAALLAGYAFGAWLFAL